jgi:uncharacterized protein YcbX
MTATVATLWRYPVKSMLGEQCDHVELNARGVRGDRQFAVRGADGRFGSGKNSRRFRHIEGLFTFRAQLGDEWPEIVFPDGRRLRADDPAIDSALSEALGTPVTLAREGEVSHFDASPIHLVGSSSLEWLRSRLPESRVDERRFRPNITVATDQSELSWIGRTLQIGSTVKLRVTAPTGRCAMTTSAQTDLPFDPKILRCIAQEAGEDFGVYAEVLQPGTISRGDEVTVI